MGGQACVFYSAAEFSRDLDLLIPVEQDPDRLEQALHELGAQAIAVPPFEPTYLGRGHAVDLRCARTDVAGLRIDLMSSLRGVGCIRGTVESAYNNRCARRACGSHEP